MPRPRATRARDGRRGVHSSCTYLAGRVRGAMADALAAQKGQAPNGTRPDLQMAEGEGFEPSYPRRGKRFSRPPHSTALPPLRGVKSGAPVGRRWIYWRRVWDLNPGYALGVYTISNRAPSATRTTLQEPRRLVYRKSLRNAKLFLILAQSSPDLHAPARSGTQTPCDAAGGVGDTTPEGHPSASRTPARNTGT